MISALVLVVPAAVAADGEPAELFAKRAEYYDAVISPGGEYIAIERAAEEGKRLVAIVDTQDLSLLGHIPAGSDYSPFNPSWANDERLIVQLTEDRGRAEFEFPNGELISIDYDGGKLRRLIERQVAVSGYRDTQPLNALHGFAEVAHRLPTEKDHVLIRFIEGGQRGVGYIPTLYRIHATRGKVVRIADAPTYSASFVFSPKGELAYSVGLDGEALKAGTNEWVVHRYVDGEWESLDDLDIDGESLRFLATGAGSNNYIEVGYADGPDRVYRYDLATGDKELVFAHAEVDASAFDFDRRTGRLVAVHFDAGYPDLHLVDPEHLYARWYPALFQAFGGNRVRITSASDDGRLLLIHVSGAREPGQFRLFDTETRDMKYLFNAAQWIDSESLAEVRPIVFQNRDGVAIHGYLALPDGHDEALPLVVMPHGGPHGVRDFWRFDPEVQFLASLGYAVLQVNFRGSDGYGWGFEEAGYGSWGTLIQNDIVDGTRWAASLEQIDGDRICIVGASFGAYSALMAPTIEPDLYRCAAGLAGVYDLELMWTTADIETTRRGENYLARAIGDDPETLRRNSPVHNIDKLKIPVLLAHGEDDWRVDVKHFDRMVRALEQAGHPHETLLVKREGHGFFNDENRAAWFTRLATFLDQHVGGTSPGSD
ncbi:MAG: S9 family peptidase [Woeseiaceae bacterium]|nr:S9 family peptidase [Woeseiaceae bacterium]